MLRATDISFRYDAKSPWILKDVSLEIEPGEILGILGPSGCGKSTLAQIMAGYFFPQKGEVRVDQAPLPAKGYCPVQLLFQHPELTVNPNWKVEKILSEAFAPSDQLMDQLEISSLWMDRRPHELSGGEIQRLAVARALGPKTRYLIADEMTAMLDAKTQAQIWHAVMDHSRRNSLGILAISHDKPLLEHICNRVIDFSNLP